MSYLRALVILLVSANASASDNLVFRDAYVAAAPPGASAMAAYMTIENPGKDARRITLISTPDFREIQMHRSTIENGVSRMQQLEQLVIEAGSKLELRPGGIHLMLLEPVHEFEPGQLIMLELREADGTEHNLGLKVQRVPAASHHH